MMIALLTLAGWTVDGLRMFLEMHETFEAGLLAFASHFWYALPMIVIIIVLTRLQSRPKLLGLTVYDGTGQLVEHQGDFHLDELTTKGMLAALRDSNRYGLHGIALPSGNNVYFTREGELTLVASFSGPASLGDMRGAIQKLEGAVPVDIDFLVGLEPPVAALAANLLASPLKRRVLAYLFRYDQTAVQSNDLAFWVEASEEVVRHALEDLGALGLVQQQSVCECTFYRLNRTPEVTTLLDRLFEWHNDWQATLVRLEQAVGRERISKRGLNLEEVTHG